jgi:hypothetical protein
MNKVSATIPVRDSQAVIGHCLESLEAFDVAVVLDNGSTDPTMAIVEPIPSSTHSRLSWRERTLARAPSWPTGSRWPAHCVWWVVRTEPATGMVPFGVSMLDGILGDVRPSPV